MVIVSVPREHEARPVDGRPETALNCEASIPKGKPSEGELIRTPAASRPGRSQFWGLVLAYIYFQLPLMILVTAATGSGAACGVFFVNGDAILTADIPSQQARNYETGQKVILSFPPTACQVLPLDVQSIEMERLAEEV